MDKSEFLSPKSRYRGEFKGQNLVFNRNLQEFAIRVSYLSNLQTNGKLSPQKVYEEIEFLWQQLENLKNQLEINE